MSKLLASIESSGSPLPPRVSVYGPPGVGKTTAATRAFKPIGLGTEDGWGLNKIPCFPRAETFDDVRQAIAELISEDHDYRTLIVDSIDGVEHLIDESVCQRNGKEFMSDFPYYRGNIESLGWVEKLLQDLDDLREKRKMQIILISHSIRVTVEDPTTGAYDRMEPNLYKKCVPLLVAWADVVGFMDFEKAIQNKGDQDSSKKVRTTRTTGNRVIHFEDNGSFIAKNRRRLPSQIAISEDQGWSAVEKAMKVSEKKKENPKK